MTRKETIEMLKILKKQALSSCNDTVIIDVKKDSFIFVINMSIKALEQEPCEDAISRKALIERINKAEDDFKADNMEIIASGGDSFVDGVLSGVFNIREMVIQAQSICKAESEA